VSPLCQGIKAKPLWPAKGQLSLWQAMTHAAIYRRSGPSTKAAAAIMSALQQSSICGLEEPEFPYRGAACQGHRAAGHKARQTGGVIP
jgi:hypothetical protein